MQTNLTRFSAGLVLSLILTTAAQAAQPPTFSARSAESLGLFDPNVSSPWQLSNAANGEWRANRNQKWTNLRGGLLQKIASNFLVEEDQTPVAIMISAEAYVAETDKRLFMRLLVDGKPMEPGDVVFANGGKTEVRAARAFEFLGLYDRGLHTVEAQWLADTGASGFIRDAAILIRQGDIDQSRGKLIGVTPASGPNLETQNEKWQDVPGLQRDIATAERESLIATVSAESYASAGDRVWIRVLIDGTVADPGPVEFASGGFEGTRVMAFGLSDLAAGTHDVRVQWKADTGGTAGLGDRTLTLSVGDTSIYTSFSQYFLSETQTTSPNGNYQTVSGLSQFAVLPEDSDVSVIFTAEFPQPATGPVWARLEIGGTPVEGSEVLLTEGKARAGVHSYTFDAKHIGALTGTQATNVNIQWKSDASPSPVIEARSMALYIKQHSVPDLAEAPPLGLSYNDGVNGTSSAGVQPMHGTRSVLVVLFDPQRAGHPAPSLSDLDTAFFGAGNSVADYYDTVSGGRFTLNKADILGPYLADNPWDYYWNGPGDHQDKWVEALTKASADFDFSQYDYNGDGYLSAWNELAVVIAVPQTASTGFVRNLWSGEMPQKIDGVYIDLITEWYTSDPVADYAVAAHELGHQILTLGDLYAKSGGSPNVGTRPGAFCLMDQGGNAITPHLNPAYKLALGWARPRVIAQTTAASLQDVKTSREVIVLPRSPGLDGDEYVILENRPSSVSGSLYDADLPDAGIAVWHIVENPTDNVNPPLCHTQAAWDTQTGGDNARRGIRLIRPNISYSNFTALWNIENYDLDAFGLTCPGPGATAHNIPVWSDSTPAYQVLGFPATGAIMNINIAEP